MRLPVAAVVMSFGMASAATSAAELPLLPMPSRVEVGVGSFSLGGARIAVADPGSKEAAERLRTLVRKSTGNELAFAANGAIRFRHVSSIAGAEAYRISIRPSGIEIRASSDAGLYYGAETLWQLIASGSEKGIRAMEIEDHPAFPWRGLMLDSSRHMQSLAYIEQLIDRMAMAKLNMLQWHLTDDQGWRIEIDRYPRLTSVGGWRQEAGAAGFDPKTGKKLLYGGFYTKAQIRQVVRYAQRHHVTIVPEIEMPGHATAMIAAYPELASIPNPPKTPSHDWGILPNLLSPADSTFTFIDNVLDEVMPLFPGPFVHVGGDEAVKDQWKTNPVAQARIKALGLKDEDALQGWFTARVGAYLQKHGKRLIGWDEIMNGKIPADAAITSWHGLDGAIAAAESGHDAVLAPAPELYLDYRQSDSPDEPPGRGELVSWQRLYQFDPSPASLSVEQRHHILGMQVNLWTEHVRIPDYADRMIWPRAAILAELAWSNPVKNWGSFSARLVAAMERWHRLELGADEVPLEPEPIFTQARGGLTVQLRQPANIGILRYSINGAISPRSPIYKDPVSLPFGARLSAQAFLGSEPLASPRMWTIEPKLARTRSASEMELCGNAIPLRLEDDGPTNNVRLIHWVDIMHPCWIWRAAPLDGAKRLAALVGQQPFNFSIGSDIEKIRFNPPVTPAGELEVRRDNCDGPLLVAIPLEQATRSSGDTWVNGTIAQQKGQHDLCMTFTQKQIDPFWVLNRLTLQ
ncbi:MAG TPA: beta-N-acetylhexosaminidase [Sphingomicrobium sp.]|nr:beta-N-acetylhexosaminidase [Sphingomicrobium sp.]